MNYPTHFKNRRNFLKKAALLPLAAVSFPLVTATATATVTPIKRAGRSHLKTSLNAYSFIELLNANLKDPTKGVDLFQVCDFCAEQNFDAVDVTGYFFPGYPDAPKDEYIYRLKKHAFDRGLAISGTGVRNDFTAANKATRDEGVARIKTWIEVAAKLGAPVIRAFADSQPPFKDWHQASGNASRDTVEGWVADSLRECAEHGKKSGVIVVVQNHGDFISTGEQHINLLKRVDHEYCTAMVDTGKYNTADPYVDIAMVAPYAVNWQIKELIGTPANSPRVDMKKLVTIIRQSGYRGYLPIETLSSGRRDYDSYQAASGMLDQLRSAIAATGDIPPKFPVKRSH